MQLGMRIGKSFAGKERVVTRCYILTLCIFHNSRRAKFKCQFKGLDYVFFFIMVEVRNFCKDRSG